MINPYICHVISVCSLDTCGNHSDILTAASSSGSGRGHRPIYYNRDAVPHIHIVSNHEATDKVTAQAECLQVG